MKFQQIRSATVIITTGGVRFLVDPWLAEKDSFPPIPGSPNPGLRCPIHDLPIPVEEILDVDAVIATHLHFDHFDETAASLIPKSMPIFAQDNVDAAALRKLGFKDVLILEEGGNEFNSVKLFKTDCYHATPGERDKLYSLVGMRGEACGVVFKHPDEEKTLYLAGDTVWYQGVENAIEKFSPYVVVVNSADAAISGFGRIIMGLEDISEVLKAAPSAIVIASHMDNVGHAKLWRKDIRAFAKENNLAGRLLVPEDGEIYSW